MALRHLPHQQRPHLRVLHRQDKAPTPLPMKCQGAPNRPCWRLTAWSDGQTSTRYWRLRVPAACADVRPPADARIGAPRAALDDVQLEKFHAAAAAEEAGAPRTDIDFI
eukprot:CAMPEP_0206245272 /NCGR_PEP_ID=MMETSP0047_2-20121206/18607_1 /ASSEMBLY_ACC=CAM_ASM_000192 /TAXON_ID=195065 /ORGANISM="Chroomonas mesostigmatica_cf, Strain CCMP1168" /LENGTH=108 /DNA_ID=CAMNT_0053670557 /DNA_START=260 /DNA_END=585 /DNA_ORIENTATION=+